jgi:hypothetical protein
VRSGFRATSCFHESKDENPERDYLCATQRYYTEDASMQEWCGDKILRQRFFYNAAKA